MRKLAFIALLLMPLTTALPLLAQSDRVVAYRIVNAQEIPVSLTGLAGDFERGRQLYFDRDATGCSGCHGSPGGPGAQPNAEGPEAPSLAGIASRLSEGRLRLWLVAPTVIRPQTAMPGYYTVGQRSDPEDPRFGEPRLSAGEIEDILAYLMKQNGS
jgi:sulfur-oxidizing protein SoxX